MRTYEICYSNSITKNRGNYENEKPFFSQKVIIQSETEIDTVAEYDKLRAIIDPMALASFKEDGLANIRIRTKDGKKYPSVTSILSGGKPYTGNPEYGTRGTEIHRLINVYSNTGRWEEPSVPLQTLKYDIGYKEFFAKFGSRIDYTDHKAEIEIFHDEHLYSGAVDDVCLVDGVKSLVDYKSGGWKWEQLVAYFKGLNDRSIKQLCVFDLKKGKLEILKLTEAVPYWENFLKLRGALTNALGV